MGARRETTGASGASAAGGGGQTGQLPLGVLLLAAGAGAAVMLAAMLRSMAGFGSAMAVVLTDGIMAGLILLSAGGYGHLLFRLTGPRGTPRLLALASSAAAGLALLATAVLIVGSLLPGALNRWVWWPVVLLGAALAVVQAHRPLGKMALPRAVGGANLVWVVSAAAVGLCLAGAVLPAGLLGGLTADAYDILEYHLQLPREYYQAGQVAILRHNVYSHYPLGVEMLFLLAMCLRGGAYEGMYLAQMLGGVFAAIMVAGVYGALGGGVGDAPEGSLPAGHGGSASGGGEGRFASAFRAISAAAILSTAPWVVYFSWLTMEEMAEVCYLALGLAWLGLWLKAGGGRSAGWTGAMLGAACAVKYLSVGFVAGPVLAVMLVVSLRRPRRVRQLVLAAAVTLAVFAPWLVRNLVSTGNPVFPLATDIFGAGYWDGESARRWRSGHAGGFHPPVPVPPDYQPQPPGPSRAGLMAAFFLREFRPGGAGEGDPYLGQPSLGLLTLPLLAGAILAMLIRPRRFGAWEWGLLAVTGMQLTAWAAFTHDMPARFIAVAVAPMSLLISGALSRLSGVRQPPLWRQSPGAGGRWGLAPAGLLVVAAVGMNLASAGLYYRTEMARYRFLGGAFGALVGLPAADAARMYRASDLAWGLPASSRLLLVGDSAAFYYPDGTAYATVFGEHPLQGMLSRAGSPAEVAGGLRRAGLTHVLVDWREIDRLRYSYGWPAVLDPDRLEGLLAGWPILKRYPPAMATSAPGPAGRPFLTLYAVPSAPPAATAPGR